MFSGQILISSLLRTWFLVTLKKTVMLFGFSREVPTRNHTNRIFHTNIQCSAERSSLFYAH